MKDSLISIIIPALNESKAIAKVICDIHNKHPKTEIIVINDGSTDNTAEIAANNGAKVINHQRTRGYGRSLRTGIMNAKGSYVLFCDADGQHSEEDVSNLMDKCTDCDMLVGVRDRDSHAPLLRRPGKWILRKFADFLAGEKIPDMNSGLRIINKKIILKYLHLMPEGFSFSTTSTFALLKGNYRIKWIPINVKSRIGKSSVRQWKHGPQALLLMLRLTVLFEPLKVFLSISSFLFLSTILSLGTDIYLTSVSGTSISDTTLLLALASLLVFLFGLLCDQVSSLRREIHEKEY